MSATYGPNVDTIRYDEPDVDVNPDRFRGVHRLMYRDDGTVRCVACMCCSTVCPAKCLYIMARGGPSVAVQGGAAPDYREKLPQGRSEIHSRPAINVPVPEFGRFGSPVFQQHGSSVHATRRGPQLAEPARGPVRTRQCTS